MKFYSTKNKNHLVDLRTAVMQSLPADNGLYMPESLPQLDQDFINKLGTKSFQEIAYRIAYAFLKNDFRDPDIIDIVEKSINFPAPLHVLNDQLLVLELWHGPSLAFKDFGARFMASIMSRFVDHTDDKKLTILVATSGDTGGAVAAGFLGVPNVEVIILYPSGGVSPLQEKQLTTLGQNITALEIEGTFDDCQSLVKSAFLDEQINSQYMLSSANSINIARLIPQSFYYFEASKNFIHSNISTNFCVPSGNFGNLTAGLWAKKMGLPINKFIAATNINDIVPVYLETALYKPRPSTPTISNAMDVGNPSNFRRMEHLFNYDWAQMTSEIVGYRYTDQQTEKAIKDIYSAYNYVMDPHGAVGYLAALEYVKDATSERVIILETAHPAKFLPVMAPLLDKIDIPQRLKDLSLLEKSAHKMTSHFSDLKSWLLSR